MKAAHARRICIYGFGLVFLAIGLTLNIKADLGAAPVLTVPLSISIIWNLEFSSSVFMVYILFVLGQIGLRRKWDWKTVLQIPFSAVFSFLLRQFESAIFIRPTCLWEQLLTLGVSIIAVAVGIGMMVDMRLISNPADGFAKVLGEKVKRGTGAGKNILDLGCVAVSCIISLMADKTIHGIGAGTLISMIMVGRVLALFNRCFKKKLEGLSGLQQRLSPRCWQG